MVVRRNPLSTITMKQFNVFVLILCVSWGFLAHKTLQQISIYQLPDDLAGYFYANQEYLVQQSISPDVRRKDDKQEDAKHYLDMDAPLFGSDYKTSIPHDFNKAIAKYGIDSLRKEGLVPWRLYVYMAVWLRHSSRRNAILFYFTRLT